MCFTIRVAPAWLRKEIRKEPKQSMNEFGFYVSRVGLDQVLIAAAVGAEPESDAAIVEAIYRKLDAALEAHGARILIERVFGNLKFCESFKKIRKKIFGSAAGPFSYIQGSPCKGEGLAGVQVHAVRSTSDEDYWLISDGSSSCGYGWKRGGTTYVDLVGITGSVPGTVPKSDQAASMFDIINRILATQGLSFRDVRRTWIYLEDILGWYSEFNAIRNKKFKGLDLIPPNFSDSEIDHLCLPASTGIGGDNIHGVACSSDVLAISGDIRFSVLPGVSQRSAFRYGSAFSRGICIDEKDCRQIYVSGTAAIDENGISLCKGNVEGQIERTLEIVEALIGEKGAKLSDIGSATVYLKRPGDLSLYKRVAARHNLLNMPAVIVNADICRDDLLFEMDAVAIVNIPEPLAL